MGGGAPLAEDLDIRSLADGGAALRLRVSAGAARKRVLGAHAGALRISVPAPPERGKANKQVVALVAEAFGVPAADVEILSGETAPDKVVRLPISAVEAARRWALRAASIPAP